MTTARHSETAFETVVEANLLRNGYASIDRETFDCARAIFPEMVLAFVRETQPKEWGKLEALHGVRTGDQMLGDLCKWLDQDGSIATLRHGHTRHPALRRHHRPGHSSCSTYWR